MVTTSMDAKHLITRTDEEDSYNKWVIFFLVAIGIFMSTLDGSIVNITLPVIMKDLDIPLTTLEWIVIVYLLTVSSLLLSFGRLSDIKGRRYVYVRGLIVFALGSLFCGISQSGAGLILSRMFQGVGAAMITSCTPALVVDTFPPNEKGKAMGMVGAVVALGLTSGPTLGGIIAHTLSWRYIFYINIPIGVLTAIVVNWKLKGKRIDVVRPESFDFPGAVFLCFCLGPLLLALTHGGHWGYLSWQVIGLLFIAIAAMVAFWQREIRTVHPILETSLLSIRLFTLPLLASVTLFASLFYLVFLMPFYLMYACGFSASQAGYLMSSVFILLFIVSPLSGAISDKIGSQLLCTLGMIILAAALYVISRLSVASSWYAIALHLIVAGIGVAIFLPPNSSVTMGSVPLQFRGIAAGLVATARNLGMVIGIALAGTIFNHWFSTAGGGAFLKEYRPELEDAFMAAFSHTMVFGAAIAGIGAVLAFLRGTDRRSEDE